MARRTGSVIVVCICGAVAYWLVCGCPANVVSGRDDGAKAVPDVEAEGGQIKPAEIREIAAKIKEGWTIVEFPKAPSLSAIDVPAGLLPAKYDKGARLVFHSFTKEIYVAGPPIGCGPGARPEFEAIYGRVPVWVSHPVTVSDVPWDKVIALIPGELLTPNPTLKHPIMPDAEAVTLDMCWPVEAELWQGEGESQVLLGRITRLRYIRKALLKRPLKRPVEEQNQEPGDIL